MPKKVTNHAQAEAEMLEHLNSLLHEQYPDGFTLQDLVQDGDEVFSLEEMEAELRATGIDPAALDYLYL